MLSSYVQMQRNSAAGDLLPCFWEEEDHTITISDPELRRIGTQEILTAEGVHITLRQEIRRFRHPNRSVEGGISVS